MGMGASKRRFSTVEANYQLPKVYEIAAWKAHTGAIVSIEYVGDWGGKEVSGSESQKTSHVKYVANLFVTLRFAPYCVVVADAYGEHGSQCEHVDFEGGPYRYFWTDVHLVLDKPPSLE